MKEKKRELESEANRIRRFKNPRRNRTYSTKNSGKDKTKDKLGKNIDVLSRAFDHRYDKNTDKLERTKGKKRLKERLATEGTKLQDLYLQGE